MLVPIIRGLTAKSKVRANQKTTRDTIKRWHQANLNKKHAEEIETLRKNYRAANPRPVKKYVPSEEEKKRLKRLAELAPNATLDPSK